MALLEIRDLHAYYGNIEAIHGISLHAEAGKITVIIGSNGAGKSTILNSVSGLVKRSGSIFYDGKLLPCAAHKTVKAGITQVPEGRQIYVGLTVQENLRLGAYLNRSTKDIHALIKKQYKLFPRLEERKNQDAGTLSGGEQQMLAISRGLMAQPRVLLLDEPSLGLAPIIVSEVFSTIQAIRDEGITVVLVEQNAKKSLSICDYAYVIENGALAGQGTGKELLENSDIASAYLGAGRD
ncbi:MAG TPA: ABC transporter ATP-binding protein [Feifaniaceae bacterium]|nr:ABC transporter ATP-binding protein [Feifaniaceae bacterium]